MRSQLVLSSNSCRRLYFENTAMKPEQLRANRTGYVPLYFRWRVLEYTNSHRRCGQAEGDLKMETFPSVTWCESVPWQWDPAGGCVGLYRQLANLALLSPVQEEAHGAAELLQVQVGQEAPLKLRLDCVSTGSTAALQENHSRLAQQPVHQLSHAIAALIGQGLPSPEAQVKHVGSNACTGALRGQKNAQNKTMCMSPEAKCLWHTSLKWL